MNRLVTAILILVVIGLGGWVFYNNFVQTNSLDNFFIPTPQGGNTQPQGQGNLDNQQAASAPTIDAALSVLRNYSGTADAEAGYVQQYGFTNQQMADFSRGMNHWTSGHGSCGLNQDPNDPEYCLFNAMLVDQQHLAFFVIDASGINFADGNHQTGFVVTNQQPYSVKDGGLITLHTGMDEQTAALAIASRLFWANRPGMTRDDAVNNGPMRSLNIVIESN